MASNPKPTWRGGSDKHPARIKIEQFLADGDYRSEAEIADACAIAREMVRSVLAKMRATHALKSRRDRDNGRWVYRYTLSSLIAKQRKREPRITTASPYVPPNGVPTPYRGEDLRDLPHVTAERMRHYRYAPSIINGERIYPAGGQS